MAETLSKAEQQHVAEEVDYYQEHHESKKKKTGYNATDSGDTYEDARSQHHKAEERRSNRVSREEREESRGRVVEDMFRSFGRGVSAVRDDLYGYRRVYEPMSNAYHIDTRSIRSSGIGNINPFSPARSGSYRMMNMNPFGVGRTSRSTSGPKKKKGRKGGRSHDDSGIPPSLSWMF